MNPAPPLTTISWIRAPILSREARRPRRRSRDVEAASSKRNAAFLPLVLVLSRRLTGDNERRRRRIVFASLPADKADRAHRELTGRPDRVRPLLSCCKCVKSARSPETRQIPCRAARNALKRLVGSAEHDLGLL